MKDNIENSIALFRYSIIVPLITDLDDSKSKSAFFRSCSLQKYKDPFGKSVSISEGTIERWYYNFLKYGFEGLKPKKRTDLGKQRKINGEIASTINHYVNTHPKLPATSIRDHLIETGVICPDEISLSTITRYINNYKSDKKINTSDEKRRYEAEHINDIWCCDTTYSYKIKIKNQNGQYENRRTYIIAIIDDASRLIVGCDIFFNDNYVNYMSVLKQAVKRYGKPKILNLDNGAPYKNGQIELLSARLGIVLHHCAPYQPTGKAKIERWFRTMKDHFLAFYNPKNITSLDEFRNELQAYVIKYNNTVHSSLNDLSPNDRFFNGKDQIINVDENTIEKTFLLEVKRKVSADGIISLDSKEFEVPYQYQNKQIKVRYSSDYNTVYVVEADNTLTKIHIVDKVANSKIKRNKVLLNTEDKE